MRPAELEDLFLQALSEPIGIKVRTNDPIRLRQYLYNFRYKNPSPAYDSIVFKFPPEKDQLYLIRKEALNGSEEG